MSLTEYLRSNVKLAGWLTLFGAMQTYFVCNSCHDSLSEYALVSLFSASIWITLWMGNEFLVLWLDSKISWTQQPVKRLIAGLVAMIVYSVTAYWSLIKFFEIILDLRINTATETMYVTTGIAFLI